MCSRKRNAEDDSHLNSMNKFLVFFMLNLLVSSSVACAMEQTITTSVSWSRLPLAPITFYYTFANTATIYDLKTQLIASLQAQLPNNHVLHYHNLKLELVLLEKHMVKQPNQRSIRWLYALYKSSEYKVTIINKRKTIDPIDDPSIEADDTPEPAKKKIRR